MTFGSYLEGIETPKLVTSYNKPVEVWIVP